MKTIFITLTRGFIVRNILRSGVLDELLKLGFRVVIFLPSKDGTLPEALRTEFSRERVILEGVPEVSISNYMLFSKIVGMFVYTRSTWRYNLYENITKYHQPMFVLYIKRAFFTVLSHIPFLKSIARYLDQRLFTTHDYDAYFEKYKPSVVFSTSIVSKLDILFMKTARRYGVPTASIPKGWDNITKLLYRFVPDLFIVQNEIMKMRAAEVQKIDPVHIAVTGFPQFDWYEKPEIIMPREEYLRSIGVPPEKKLIFYGSEGVWAPDDTELVEKLITAVNTPGTFVSDCVLLVRPHFSDAPSGRFNRFKGSPNFILDESLTSSTFFMDNWDPSIRETEQFVNLLKHCDVLISAASTLSLDGVCFDRPLINIGFGVLHDRKTGEEMSHLLYIAEHMQWVLRTGAVDIVHSYADLFSRINDYLKNPALKRAERTRLLDELCFRVDGQSSKRIAQALNNLTS